MKSSEMNGGVVEMNKKITRAARRASLAIAILMPLAAP